MVKKISKIRFLIHNKTLFKSLFYFANKTKFQGVTPDDFNKKGRLKLNYKFNCINPRSFNEITCWIKSNYRNDLWNKCADKLGTKKFLNEIGLGEYVPKTLSIYNSSSEINLIDLPDKFVLKTNHDSGSVFFCEKGKTNFANVFKRLDESIQHNYSANTGEWVYENIKPLIFAEEFLYPLKGKLLVDYKFFSFNGIFGWGFTGQNRTVDSRFCVFEDDFKIQNVEYIYLKPAKKDMPPKPNSFSEMVNVSNKISKILDFVRVDFYETTQGPKIGELTFFSQSGFGAFTKKQYDFKYGELFKNTKLYRLIK